MPRKITNVNEPTVSVADMKVVNDAIRMWVPKVRTALKSSARWFSDGKDEPFVTRGKRIEGKLANSIESNTGEQYGVIDRVGFKFERHGVFVHKGVGRKYPITGPQPVKDPSGKVRVAVEWFNPELEKYVPELADKLAELNADLAVNAARLHIV